MNSIQILINNQCQVVEESICLKQIIESFSLPDVGCVFAINNQVIPKSEWSSTHLADGDSISLFQAIAGG